MKFTSKHIVYITLIIFSLFIFSCSTNSDNIQNKLIGTWVLDSESTARNGLQKVSGESQVIRIFDKTDYSFEFWNDDITGKFYGKYFILKNPSRRLYTITFIPDLQTFAKDTVRSYMNYDIIVLSDSTLKMFEPTQNIKHDNGYYSSLNKVDIFKRHK